MPQFPVKVFRYNSRVAAIFISLIAHLILAKWNTAEIRAVENGFVSSLNPRHGATYFHIFAPIGAAHF